MAEEKYVIICSDCREEIKQIHAGDEGWDYCESCGAIEGDTECITEEEYIKEQDAL